MSWIRGGTITVQNGSGVITGTGTSWNAGVRVGDALIGPDARTYEITSIVSATELQISGVYLGGNVSGASYMIAPTRGLSVDLTAQVQALISEYTDALHTALAGKFGAGSASTNGITFAGDQDTGLYLAGPNRLGISGSAGVTGSGVQSAPNDATAEKIMLTGAFGLGAGVAIDAPDLNTISASGFYRAISSTINAPVGGGGHTILHQQHGADFASQLFVSTANDKSFVRRKSITGWHAWRELLSTDLAENGNFYVPFDFSVGAPGRDWSANWRGISFPTGGLGTPSSAASTAVFSNAYPAEGGTVYIEDGVAGFSSVSGNVFTFNTAPDGVAGQSLGAWTEIARLTDVGLGIGRTPIAKIDVTQAAAQLGARVRASDASYATDLMRGQVARGASSAFNFLTCMASDGADTVTRLRGDGVNTTDGSWAGGGADVAEFFEWADGNPNGEDRRGLSVVLVAGKIAPAGADDVPVGVISANPSLVGDADIDHWRGKYLRDDFGSLIYEAITVATWFERMARANAAGDQVVHHSYATDQIPAGVTVPDDAVITNETRRMINPTYDPDQAYATRADRPEWDMVGLLGKLRLIDGQPVAPGWIKLRDISDTVSEWLVR